RPETYLPPVPMSLSDWETIPAWRSRRWHQVCNGLPSGKTRGVLTSSPCIGYPPRSCVRGRFEPMTVGDRTCGRVLTGTRAGDGALDDVHLSPVSDRLR